MAAVVEAGAARAGEAEQASSEMGAPGVAGQWQVHAGYTYRHVHRTVTLPAKGTCTSHGPIAPRWWRTSRHTNTCGHNSGTTYLALRSCKFGTLLPTSAGPAFPGASPCLKRVCSRTCSQPCSRYMLADRRLVVTRSVHVAARMHAATMVAFTMACGLLAAPQWWACRTVSLGRTQSPMQYAVASQ